eukprot:3934693-Rhodomonas_salina.1
MAQRGRGGRYVALSAFTRAVRRLVLTSRVCWLQVLPAEKVSSCLLLQVRQQHAAERDGACGGAGAHGGGADAVRRQDHARERQVQVRSPTATLALIPANLDSIRPSRKPTLTCPVCVCWPGQQLVSVRAAGAADRDARDVGVAPLRAPAPLRPGPLRSQRLSHDFLFPGLDPPPFFLFFLQCKLPLLAMQTPLVETPFAPNADSLFFPAVRKGALGALEIAQRGADGWQCCCAATLCLRRRCGRCGGRRNTAPTTPPRYLPVLPCYGFFTTLQWISATLLWIFS